MNPAIADDNQYFLGHSSAEQRRLQRQAEELAEESAHLFDQIGAAEGSRAIEIGCGPQGCLELLSSRVGPTGSVVGVELSDHAVQLARDFLSERRINNVEVRQGHAADTGLPREWFDLATAHLVLVNIPEPEKIVSEMVALVKPGGVVALHEADWIAHVCDPPIPAWDRLRHIYGPDHSRRPIFLQFVNNLRDRIVAQGLISEAEFAESIASLECHLGEPDTLVVSHLFIQAWGRKP